MAGQKMDHGLQLKSELCNFTKHMYVLARLIQVNSLADVNFSDQ